MSTQMFEKFLVKSVYLDFTAKIFEKTFLHPHDTTIYCVCQYNCTQLYKRTKQKKCCFLLEKSKNQKKQFFYRHALTFNRHLV